VHETETLSLKAYHAKNWAQDKYTEKLSPFTRQTIQGVIVVAKLAAGVLLM
jgi:superfamily II helicase